MLLTQLEYFVALARERHFGRAAAACFVSPSALSESIRKLEAELGAPLVARGRNFEGLTREGELALTWAQRIVHSRAAMLADISAANGALTAHARVGAIPEGAALGAAVLSALGREQPGMTASLATGLSSEETVAKLRDFELDAGVILAPAGNAHDLHAVALGEVAVVVVAPAGTFPGGAAPVAASMLAHVPLALLSPGMRARQLCDEQLAAAGITLRPRLEVDSAEGLLSLVAQGPWVAVVPESTITDVPLASALQVLPLSEPRIALPLAVVRLAHEPVSALAQALDAAIASALPTN